MTALRASAAPRLRAGVPLALSVLLALFLGVCAPALAQDFQPVPRLQARVTDLTGTLTAEQQVALEEKLAAFEARKGAQIAVLLVPTTAPEEIEQYSIRVVEEWQLGRKGVDDGALLLVAKDDRRVRIEVGYGLEGVLTDATSNRIIEDTIVPLFRRGHFYDGISAGVDQMIRVIDGEPLPEPDRRWRGGEPSAVPGILVFLFLVVPVMAVVLRAMFGRVLGATFTGGGTGLLVWLLSSLVGISVLAGVIAFLYAIVAGMTRHTHWSSLPRHGGWGGGWGGFGGGGLGGGFGGGFRGGGGGFGGGGASGSW